MKTIKFLFSFLFNKQNKLKYTTPSTVLIKQQYLDSLKEDQFLKDNENDS